MNSCSNQPKSQSLDDNVICQLRDIFEDNYEIVHALAMVEITVSEYVGEAVSDDDSISYIIGMLSKFATAFVSSDDPGVTASYNKVCYLLTNGRLNRQRKYGKE
jgi:hypothetical protein